MRDFRLWLEWLFGRLRWELSDGTPLELGGHSMPWWRWRNYRLFYRRRRRREERSRSDSEAVESEGD